MKEWTQEQAVFEKACNEALREIELLEVGNQALKLLESTKEFTTEEERKILYRWIRNKQTEMSVRISALRLEQLKPKDNKD